SHSPSLSHFYRYIIFPTLFSPDTATPQLYTLSLHDALPIFLVPRLVVVGVGAVVVQLGGMTDHRHFVAVQGGDDVARHLVCAYRSEEHTSELQSRENLVCRLLLEKKNQQISLTHHHS